MAFFVQTPKSHYQEAQNAKPHRHLVHDAEETQACVVLDADKNLAVGAAGLPYRLAVHSVEGW